MNVTVQNGKAQLGTAHSSAGTSAADIFPALSPAKPSLDANFKNLIASSFQTTTAQNNALSAIQSAATSGGANKKGTNRNTDGCQGERQNPIKDSIPTLAALPVLPPTLPASVNTPAQTRATVTIPETAVGLEAAGSASMRAPGFFDITTHPIVGSERPAASTPPAGEKNERFVPDATNASIQALSDATQTPAPARPEPVPESALPSEPDAIRTSTIASSQPHPAIASAGSREQPKGEKVTLQSHAEKNPSSANVTGALEGPRQETSNHNPTIDAVEGAQTQNPATSDVLPQEPTSSLREQASQSADTAADSSSPSAPTQGDAALRALMLSAQDPVSPLAQNLQTASASVPTGPGDTAPQSSGGISAAPQQVPAGAVKAAKMSVNSPIAQGAPTAGRSLGVGQKKETGRTEAAKTKTGSSDDRQSSSSQSTGADPVHQPGKPESGAQDKTSVMDEPVHSGEIANSAAKSESPRTSHEAAQVPQGNPQGIKGDLDGDEIGPGQPPSIVNTAKLIQGIAQSELRIGLQSRELGSIDIRTSIAAHMFSAQIFVEHRDVANTLSSELPGLYSRLADQRVLAGPIQIHSDGLFTSAGFDQGKRQEHVPSAEFNFKMGTVERESKSGSIFEAVTVNDRLDIRI